MSTITWQENGLTVMNVPCYLVIYNSIGECGTFNKVVIAPRNIEYIKQFKLKAKALACGIDIKAFPDYNFYVIKNKGNVEIACMCDKLVFSSLYISTLGYYRHQIIKVLDLSHAEFRPSTERNGMLSARACFANLKVDRLILGKLDTSRVEVMDKMFYMARIGNIQEIVNKLDTSRARSMQYMFTGSRGDTLDVSRMYTGNVLDMLQMFSLCHYKHLDISYLGGSVVRASYMLRGAKLSRLTSNNLQFQWAKDLTGMFADASIRSAVDISSLYTGRDCVLNSTFDKLKTPIIKLNKEWLEFMGIYSSHDYEGRILVGPSIELYNLFNNSGCKKVCTEDNKILLQKQ